MEGIRREGVICGIIWSIYVCYLCCATYQASKRLESTKSLARFLSDGWEFIDRKQDISDIEWLFWKHTLFPRLFAWVCVHIGVSFCLQLFHLQKARKYLFSIVSIAFLLTQVGFVACVFYLSQIIILTTIALTTTSKPLVWTLSLLFLSFVFTPSLKAVLTSLCNTHNFSDSMLLDYIFTMGMLRYTSCALCILDAIKRKDARAVEKLIDIKIRDVSKIIPKINFETQDGASDLGVTGPVVEQAYADDCDQNVHMEAFKPVESEPYNHSNGHDCSNRHQTDLSNRSNSLHDYIEKSNNADNNNNNNNNNNHDVNKKTNNIAYVPNADASKGGYSAEFVGFNLSKEDWLVEADWGLVMAYNLYLPLLATGPFLTYESFCHQFKDTSNNNNSSSRRDTLTNLLKSLLKVTFWTSVLEVSNHFSYHHAIISSPALMRHLPLWSVAGSAYIAGQFFMLKYFVIWTLTSSLARLDGLVTPQPPSCISHIYLYSDMWKLFDKGFYEFLKCYIYIPLGGQRSGRVRQTISLVVPFTFVFLWHGADGCMGVWTTVNVLALFLEKCLNDFYRSPCFDTFCSTKLSPLNTRRLQTLLVLPLFGLSTAGIFVFLASVEASYVLVYRTFVEGFPVSFLHLAFVGYCFVQFSKSRKDSRTKHHHTN